MKQLLLICVCLALFATLSYGQYETVLLEENSEWTYTFAYRPGWNNDPFADGWWSRGDLSFGNDQARAHGFPCETEWPEWSTLYARSYFTLPESCESVLAHIAIDNAYVLFVNGAVVDSVYREGFAWKWQYNVPIPMELLNTAPDSNLVCVRGIDWGQGTGFDMMITGYCPVVAVEGAFFGDLTESGAVRLRWVVGSLAGIEGFDVHRATSPDGPFVRVNEATIPATSPGEFEDNTVWPGTGFWYELRAHLSDGTEDIVQGSPVSVRTGGRLVAELRTPSPNPFQNETILQFDVPGHSGPVRLAVYNVAGRLVKTLLNGPKERGRHSVVWDGSDGQGRAVPAGAYFVRLDVDGETRTEKMVVAR
jgi:hypothetical protein